MAVNNDITATTGTLSALDTGNVRGPFDLLLTKVSVDFQNLTAEHLPKQMRATLETFAEVAQAEAVFVALIGGEPARFTEVYGYRRLFAAFNPEVLKGRSLEELPWLAGRLDHLKLAVLADVDAPAPGQEKDAKTLAALAVGSCVGIAFQFGGGRSGFLGIWSSATRDKSEADLHLALKLAGASAATGLERIALREELAIVQERDHLVTNTANDGLWDYDVKTNVIFFSPRWRTMLGYDADESVPEWRLLVHPDDMARVQAQIREHLEGKTQLFESVHRMRHASGDWRWVQSRIKGMMDNRGRLKRLVGVETDITERKLYEEALFREKESAQITLQSIGDGVVTTDANCIVQYVNPVGEEITGWRVDDAVARPVDEIFRGFHEETCEPLENPLAAAMRRNRSIKSRSTLLIRRDGNEIYIESTASPIRDANGKVSGGVLVFHDVSEARELNRKLSYQTSHDLLTGLVNRKEFEKRLERAIKSAQAGETSYAVLYLDLDQFKIINDSAGHAEGDRALFQVGNLLKGKIRWRDSLSRLGGDEFAVLLESCTLDEAVRTAEMLREEVAEFKFVREDRTFRLTVSVGVVPLTGENEDVAGVMSAADSACAAAKEAGRDRVYSYQENDIDLMRRRREMQWAARINNALEENRFELFRQTIEPLQEQGLGSHYELLLRMRDEAGALVSPELFINAAERYGITPSIDRWVIRNAFRWLVSEADERERLALCSINLSGQSLGDDKFLPFVIDQFHSSGLDATKICFEITETAAIASYSQANRFINALKELGCKFALDDFGTGLSSFGYLKHFPVDFLKIDGSFVKEILHDPIDREMVRSINEIGHLTGKQTIAEFAENQEIITMLRGIGVDYAQGYGVSEPKKVLQAVA